MGCNGPLLFQHAGIEYYETTRNFKKNFMNLGAKNWSKKIMKRRLLCWTKFGEKLKLTILCDK